jgi:muramidase (phage lysozyme)
LLDTIASGESQSYADIYGGGKITDFSKHPGLNVPITSGPNAGKTSSAAMSIFKSIHKYMDANYQKLPRLRQRIRVF